MLQSLTIRNFKGLNKIEICGLSRINIIGGVNNIGKSTVLEAVCMLTGWMFSRMHEQQVYWRNSSQAFLSIEWYWNIIRCSSSVDDDIIISAKVLSGKVEKIESINIAKERGVIPGLAGKNIFGDEDWTLRFIHDRSANIRTANLALHGEPGRLILASEGGPVEALFNVYYSHNRMRALAEDVKLFSQFVRNNREGDVIGFLKQFEPRIKSITPLSLGEQTELFVDMGLPGKIPITQLGDGTVRMLSIFLRIAQYCQNGILLIDEVENGIHHSIMADYWRAIAAAAIQYNCQIFATTHSYECIQAAYEGIAAEQPGLLNYIRLDRRKSGELYAKSYDDQTLETSFDVGLEVR